MSPSLPKKLPLENKQVINNKPASIKEQVEDSKTESVQKPHLTQDQIIKQKYSEIFNTKRVCTEKCKSAFCNQEDDMWVLCDICEEWYHFQCVGIDRNTFQSGSEWFCYTCSV